MVVSFSTNEASRLRADTCKDGMPFRFAFLCCAGLGIEIWMVIVSAQGREEASENWTDRTGR